MTPSEHDPRLTAELAPARAAIGAARLAGDPAAEAVARAHLHSIRSALGLRDESWWEHVV